MTEPVLTKRQNYRLWRGGAIGNKLRAWRSIAEWFCAGCPEPVALRSLRGGGDLCAYNLSAFQVGFAVQQFHREGIRSDQIMVNEMDTLTQILQGEYLNDVCTIDGEVQVGHFFYSRVRLRMRDALKAAPQVTHGLRADLMIRQAMTPASYEDWQELLTRYPGHVLEVSIYENCLGDLPHRNALVWEVRKY